jgi:hypothetical protein
MEKLNQTIKYKKKKENKLKKKKLIKDYDFSNFDINFYKKNYKDLERNGIISDNEIKLHWIKFGEKEGRIPNINFGINKYNDNLKEIFNEYNNLKIIKKKENLLNILIRTTKNRKCYLNKCLNSIKNQNYNNFNIYIHYDDYNCLSYLKDYNNIKYYNSNIKSSSKYKYNLYNNFLKNLVNEGYIIYIDDDDCFTHNNVFNLINQNLSENIILNWKFLRPDNIIYSDKNITFGNIASCSICFHSKFKNKSNWIDKQGSDFIFFDNLLKNTDLKIKKLPYILSKTIYNNKIQNHGNQIDLTNNNKYIDNNYFNNKNIFQIKVSNSLIHFKNRFLKKYNLKEYFSKKKPCIFLGFYNENDINFIKKHKGKKYIIFGGSDIDDNFDANHVNYVIKNLKSLKFAKFFSISENILNRLKKYNIKNDYINFSLIDNNIFKSIEKKGEKIFVYNGLIIGNKDINYKKYGGTYYSQLIKKLKNFEFIFSSDINVKYEDMPSIYSQCFIGLRLTNKDGNANTAQEMNAMNIPIIHNHSSFGLKWNNLNDIIYHVNHEFLKYKNKIF